MKPEELVKSRRSKGLEQQEAAQMLSVSQPYLSLLESGKRKLTPRLAKKAVKVFGMTPSALPLEEKWLANPRMSNEELARALAVLGYPGFSHLSGKRNKTPNPAQVLLSALLNEKLEARVAEGLPWLVSTYAKLDWEQTVKLAKTFDVQNTLGFVVSLALKLSVEKGDTWTSRTLSERLKELAGSRLLADSAFPSGVTQTELKYLRNARSKEAKYWRVLSDMSFEQLKR